MSTLEIPRRNRADLMNMAELAISDAIAVTETVGADPRLTDAVVLLGAARDSVADFVDAVPTRRRVVIEDAPPKATKIVQLSAARDAMEGAAIALAAAAASLEPINEPVGGRRPDNMAVEVRSMRRNLAEMKASVQRQIDKVFNNG